MHHECAVYTAQLTLSSPCQYLVKQKSNSHCYEYNKSKETFDTWQVLLPQMTIRMWQFDDPNTTTKSPIVHPTIDLPLILLRIIHLHCLQIRSTIETTNCHKLSIDDSKANLSTGHHCNMYVSHHHISEMWLLNNTLVISTKSQIKIKSCD